MAQDKNILGIFPFHLILSGMSPLYIWAPALDFPTTRHAANGYTKGSFQMLNKTLQYAYAQNASSLVFNMFQWLTQYSLDSENISMNVGRERGSALCRGRNWKVSPVDIRGSHLQPFEASVFFLHQRHPDVLLSLTLGTAVLWKIPVCGL